MCMCVLVVCVAHETKQVYQVFLSLCFLVKSKLARKSFCDGLSSTFLYLSFFLALFLLIRLWACGRGTLNCCTFEGARTGSATSIYDLYLYLYLYLKNAFVVVLLHLIVLHKHTHTQVARCTLQQSTKQQEILCAICAAATAKATATGAINQNPRESVKNIDIEYR